MSQAGPGIDVGLVAGEDIASFRFVSLDGDGRLRLSTGTAYEMAIGVSESSAGAGSGCAVTFVGCAQVECSTSICAGAPVSSDGEGRAMSWLDALSPVLAVALNDSGGAGQVIRVLVTMRPFPIFNRRVIAISPDRFAG
jgi:hypothetical protein